MATMAAARTAESPLRNSRSCKLKIAQLCPYDINRPGGVQRHIFDLSAALRKMGHEVTIIAPCARSRAKNGLVHPDPSACSIVYVGIGRLIAFNKTQFEITLALGDQLKHLDKVLQTGAFDVVHFHTLLSPFLPIQTFRRSHSANVATFHEVPPDTKTGSIQRFLYRTLSRRLMSQLDGIILASEVQKGLHLIGDVSPLAILPPCTDLHRFFEATETPLERYRDDRMNILFLGRLEPRKGAIVLLQAYLELCRQGLPVRLLVAGDGPERPMLERFVQKHRVSEVVFLGRIDDADVPRWYATCDIFCAPSLYAEGFGIVLAEAMASGKPIVAAANAGYQTLLYGEAARFLVRPGDAEAFRSKLETLVVDPSLRHRLGEWGRSEAKRYDSDTLAPQFVAIYEQAIRSKLHRGKVQARRAGSPVR
jgi:phosphatidylinositol alpha-mannosyltransferase